MGSPGSVYKEVGLTGMSVTSGNRSRKKVIEYKRGSRKSLLEMRERPKTQMGHRFMWHKKASSLGLCDYCRRPKFAVESQKCRGKRK